MNSIEETDPQFLNKLQQNGLDPYLIPLDFAIPNILSLSNGGVSFGNEFVR
jgi:hypothetical protein